MDGAADAELGDQHEPARDGAQALPPYSRPTEAPACLRVILAVARPVGNSPPMKGVGRKMAWIPEITRGDSPPFHRWKRRGRLAGTPPGQATRAGPSLALSAIDTI